MARLLALASSFLGLLLAATAAAASDECAGEQFDLAGLADTHAMQVSATEGVGMQADAALDRSLLLKVSRHHASDGAGPVSRVVETLRKAFRSHEPAGKAKGAREQEATKDSARPAADANSTEAAGARAAPEEAHAQSEEPPKETAAPAREGPPKADDAKPQEPTKENVAAAREAPPKVDDAKLQEPPKENAAAAQDAPPEADDAKPQEHLEQPAAAAKATERSAAPEATGARPQAEAQEQLERSAAAAKVTERSAAPEATGAGPQDARADASQQAQHQSDAQPKESSRADGWTSNDRMASDHASAVGDPHLQNIRKEKFEIRKQGEFEMLTIPRGVAAGKALLQVVAGVKALDGKCGGMYIQRLTFTGRWMEKLPSLHFSTGTDLFNAPETRGFEVGDSGNLSVEEFISMVPASMVKLAPAMANVPAPMAANKHVTTMVASLSVGPKVLLKVSWVAEKRKLFPGFANGLWLTVSDLNKANASIGGLLGFDDHTGASTSPPECGGRPEDHFGQIRADDDDSMMLGVGRRSLGAQGVAAIQFGQRRDKIVAMAAAALDGEDYVTDSSFQAAPATTTQAKTEDVLLGAFGEAGRDRLRHAFDSKATDLVMQTKGRKSALHHVSMTPKEFALLKRAFKSMATSGDD